MSSRYLFSRLDFDTEITEPIRSQALEELNILLVGKFLGRLIIVILVLGSGDTRLNPDLRIGLPRFRSWLPSRERARAGCRAALARFRGKEQAENMQDFHVFLHILARAQNISNKSDALRLSVNDS